MEKKHYGILSLPVIVAALGYFVDIYDLLLFGIIRIAKLTYHLDLSETECISCKVKEFSIGKCGDC